MDWVDWVGWVGWVDCEDAAGEGAERLLARFSICFGSVMVLGGKAGAAGCLITLSSTKSTGISRGGLDSRCEGFSSCVASAGKSAGGSGSPTSSVTNIG